jgi:hypothetical protein
LDLPTESGAVENVGLFSLPRGASLFSATGLFYQRDGAKTTAYTLGNLKGRAF